jgi:hypothetical protein
MAIDVFSEKVMRLSEAVRLLPKTSASKRLHVRTLYRWIQRGLRSNDGMVVRLEAVKVGGLNCTSQEALQRFFDRLTGNTTVVTPPSLTSRQHPLYLYREAQH